MRRLETLEYNVHDRLRIRVNRPAGLDLIEDINQPLSYFRTPHSCSSPDITLNIGAFTPDNSHCDVIDHRFLVKRDYLFCTEVVDKVRCTCEITGLESSAIVMNVHTSLRYARQIALPSLIAFNIFLRPIIDYKLLELGIVSIHGAGVSSGTDAFVFSGRGGSHKTTLVMDLIRKHNLRFIGEDRILIDANRDVFAYPIHHRLFGYRLAHMETEDYGRWSKLRYLIYQGRGGSLSQHHICTRSQLKCLLSIVRHTGTTMSQSKITPPEMALKLRISQQAENISSPVIMGMSAGRMYEYLAAYAFKYPDSRAATYWTDYEGRLCDILQEDSYDEFYLPDRYTPTIAAALRAHILAQ